MALTADAQRPHNGYGHDRMHDRGPGREIRDGHERGSGRRQIECATREQMNLTLKVLEDQSFDDKRLEIANLCVTLGHFCVDDLARMAEVFSFDDNRLKFLVYAYDFCEDPQYYYSLRDSFAFESNFDTLMEKVQPGNRRH